ncbi:MAG: class I SAM-dependent methyltransferase [Patescibacteria group bacterium]
MKNLPPKSLGSSPPKSTSWEPVAGWYDNLLSGEASGDTYQAKVILPNLMRILPAKKSEKSEGSDGVSGVGRKILDIACGQGFFSHAYAAAGADVLGIDISSELIKRAREGLREVAQKNGGTNPRFEVDSASRISAAKNQSFDAAIIVLALQNIKEMNETIKEASRALVKGGTFVIVLNHPCFRVLKGSAWGFDENSKTQYRRIDRYGSAFSVEVDMTPGAKSDATKSYTMSFHRPLQDYFKALSSAGFGVVGLEEWISHKQSQIGPRAKAEDTARKEFPMFMAMVCKKL